MVSIIWVRVVTVLNLMEHVHFGAYMVLREILHDSDVDGGNDSRNVDGDDRS